MVRLLHNVEIPDAEIEMHAVRSQGAGGQNVNKVASAIHLRFDIRGSSLPEGIKDRMLRLRDQRITRDGVVIIKAQRYRDQEKNRQDALERLRQLVRGAAQPRKRRRPTRPGRAAIERRLQAKKHRGRKKSLRGPVSGD
ncbi:aminoacyl-tRNA hydrolase [Ectothiorhodospiraceae bacterium WFHF3C12]|nr:aminoacyl-tRNA hydrolase [Ectothiorhodospiraceae bacterium WFHF3C12]